MPVNFKKIAKAVLLSLLLSIAAMLALSAVVFFADVSDRTVLTLVMLLSAAAVFVGALVLARNIEGGGLINGLVVGTVYFAVLTAISFAVKGSLSFGSQNALRCVSVLAAGMLGGVVGINTRAAS